MSPEQWANRVELCMRRLEPNEQPPHSVVDFPAQYASIVAVIRDAVAELADAVLPRFLELKHYREQREGKVHAQDFDEIEAMLRAAIRHREPSPPAG